MIEISYPSRVSDSHRPRGADGHPAPDGPSTDLQTFAGQLRRMNSEFNRMAHEFARAQNLHHTDVLALIAILDGDDQGSPLTPGRLCERLNLTSGAVTACLDRLERSGHIRRTRDGSDRRVVHLHYAPHGKAVARAFFRPLARSTEAARSRFDEGELKTIVRFLIAMNEELAEQRLGR
ncbi:DNA-binding transcriptional regulator, MarR family [Thermomonospora echinospora]|uniref:DNA-binding transcriptional regulator, MarR family n=1 Tax=Thermomonospora echinospora TaxID=1992 RepID=A0A1H6E2U3_9ACTN|nr:DNA-binding transcriptional regulator, MarR family [Thermomonospora echinospora]